MMCIKKDSMISKFYTHDADQNECKVTLLCIAFDYNTREAANMVLKVRTDDKVDMVYKVYNGGNSR